MFIIMTFSTVQLRQADLFVQPVLQTCSSSPNLSHMAHSLHCCALPPPFPQLVLMALLPGSCPGGTWSACCYLSPVGRLCLSSIPCLPASTTCHFSPCSDLQALSHGVNMQVQLTFCTRMVYANKCMWLDMDARKHTSCDITHGHTKAKAL